MKKTDWIMVYLILFLIGIIWLAITFGEAEKTRQGIIEFEKTVTVDMR